MFKDKTKSLCKETTNFAIMQTNKQLFSPIKQRILYFADTLGISKRDFYKKINVSRGTLESNTGITEEILAKFIVVYPEISIEWLILGEGEMLKQATTEQKEVLPCGACVEKDRVIKNLNDLIDRLRGKK